MLALSGAAHLGLTIVALVVLPLFGTPLRLEPVAVVDLVGGGEFRREEAKPPGPAPSARQDRDARAQEPVAFPGAQP